MAVKSVETEMQKVREDLEQLKKDVAFIREILLRKAQEHNISEDLQEEFQEWDFLSDEAIKNF